MMIKAISKEDQELLSGIYHADNRQITKVYNLALPSVIQYVKANNGSESDARDVFQDAIIAIFNKIKKEDLVLSCTLKSYLRIICRNLWLNKLRKSQKYENKEPELLEDIALDHDMLEQLERADQENVYMKHFGLLGDSCKKILASYFDKIPVKQIAIELNTSESYVKKRKFLCKEKLIKSIQADPIYDSL